MLRYSSSLPLPRNLGGGGGFWKAESTIYIYSHFHCPNYIEHLGAGTMSDSPHCPPYPVEGLASGSL